MAAISPGEVSLTVNSRGCPNGETYRLYRCVCSEYIAAEWGNVLNWNILVSTRKRKRKRLP